MIVTNYYVTSDAMGSVTAILDEDGNVLERRSYEAFGEVTCMLPDGSPVEISPTGVDAGFQGQIRDEVSGLYQMGYRWYDAPLGRWASRDPIGLAGDVNQSRFALNCAVDNKDDYGLTAGSNWDFLFSWMIGGGESHRDYSEGTVEVREFKDSDGADKLRKRFYEMNCRSLRGFTYGSGEAFIHTFWKPWTTEFQVGGFAGAVARRNNDCTVTFIVTNVAGTHSFFYHMVNDVPDTFTVKTPSLVDEMGHKTIHMRERNFTTPGRNITQVFEWTEKIDRCKCDC